MFLHSFPSILVGFSVEIIYKIESWGRYEAYFRVFFVFLRGDIFCACAAAGAAAPALCTSTPMASEQRHVNARFRDASQSSGVEECRCSQGVRSLVLHLEEEELEDALARVLEGVLGEGRCLHGRRDADADLEVDSHRGGLIAVRVDGHLVTLENLRREGWG